MAMLANAEYGGQAAILQQPVGGIALIVFITWLFIPARQSILIAGIIPQAIVNAWGNANSPMSLLATRTVMA